MKPTNIRDATFSSLRQNLGDARKAVYEAWVVHGPATTRELARKSGIDILTLRPRTTDLYNLGLVELVGTERTFEGVYRAVAEERWSAWHRDYLVAQLQLL